MFLPFKQLAGRPGSHRIASIKPSHNNLFISLGRLSSALFTSEFLSERASALARNEVFLFRQESAAMHNGRNKESELSSVVVVVVGCSSLTAAQTVILALIAEDSGLALFQSLSRDPLATRRRLERTRAPWQTAGSLHELLLCCRVTEKLSVITRPVDVVVVKVRWASRTFQVSTTTHLAKLLLFPVP